MGELTRLEVPEEAMTLVFTNPSPPTPKPILVIALVCPGSSGTSHFLQIEGRPQGHSLGLSLGADFFPWQTLHPWEPGLCVQTRADLKDFSGLWGRTSSVPCTKRGPGWKTVLSRAWREGELTGSADGASGHLAELRGPWRPQFPCHTTGPGCRSLALGACWGKPVWQAHGGKGTWKEADSGVPPGGLHPLGHPGEMPQNTAPRKSGAGRTAAQTPTSATPQACPAPPLPPPAPSSRTGPSLGPPF